MALRLWLGFPKSLDISKAIDKKLGAEREKVRIPASKVRNPKSINGGHGVEGGDRPWMRTALEKGFHEMDGNTPVTPEAKQWEGWGTCLKPANEPIVLARKPLSEKTIAENVMKWGTGGINVDGCRIGTDIVGWGGRPSSGYSGGLDTDTSGKPRPVEGRFPANVILDEEAGRMLDEQHKGASRFFYCAKASKKERNMGLEDMPEVVRNDGRDETLASGNMPHNRGNVPKKNHHPTVKPIKLMEYLITLITPPNGIVLDPFLGSGTTALAALNLGRFFIGIELNEEYCEIARRRIEQHKTQTELFA